MIEADSSAERIHGSLVDVGGVGVLLLGRSGIGKSEAALELVMRGHRLVADDVVLIAEEDGTPVGRSHQLVRHYLELRGIGIVHVPSLFGEAAVAERAPIDLVVQLTGWSEGEVDRVPDAARCTRPEYRLARRGRGARPRAAAVWPQRGGGARCPRAGDAETERNLTGGVLFGHSYGPSLART